MNWILKQKKEKAKALLVALFLVAIFFGSGAKDASAADSDIPCDFTKGIGKECTTNPLFPVCNTKSEKCADDNTARTATIAVSAAATAVDSLADWASGEIAIVFKGLLYSVLVFLGWVLGIAATLFEWAVNPNGMSGGSGVLQYAAIRNVWIMVRDTLNMVFILVLLFAAFCTVFQIEKWNLKKVWLAILINALLVNFSFPIARFFIDISNVAMYYFLNRMYDGGIKGGSGIMAAFGNSSDLAKLLVPGKLADATFPYLIAAIVFTFIFAATLLVLAVMFVIRIVALAMLVMFSPIGFVGYIFPKSHSFADDWWSNLFKYSFFGPIMVFMMAVALKVMEEAGTQSSFITEASKNTVNNGNMDASWLASAAFYTIPIIILWTAMGISQKMGIAGASAVVGSAQKWSKGFGKWAVNTPWHATGIPGGAKQIKDYYGKRGIKLPGFKNRHFGSDQTEGTDSWIAQNIGRVPNAYDNNMLKKIGEASKEHNMEDMAQENLEKLVRSGSSAERLAATEQLAKNGDINGLQLANVISSYGADSAISKRILSKVKETRPDLAFAHISDPGTRENEMRNYINSDKFDAKKLGSTTLKNVEFMSAVMAEGKLDQKAVEALGAKNKRNGDIIKQTVTTVANNMASSSPGTINTANANTRNIHLAHLAATGKIHSSLSDAANGSASGRAQLFKKLSKDNAASLDASTIADYGAEISKNLDSGKLLEVVKGIRDKDVKRSLIQTIENAPLPPDPNTAELKRVIANDSYLKSFI